MLLPEPRGTSGAVGRSCRSGVALKRLCISFFRLQSEKTKYKKMYRCE